jgi:dual specificity phosphatase 12
MMDEIAEGLYLGPVEAAKALDKPSNKSGWFVLSIMDNAPRLKYVKQLNIKLTDWHSSNMAKWFDIATRAIQNHLDKGQSVLLHCQMGISRSATMTIAYLMKSRGWSYKKALAYVEGKRPRINPNPGFHRQLQVWEIFLNTNRKK